MAAALGVGVGVAALVVLVVQVAAPVVLKAAWAAVWSTRHSHHISKAARTTRPTIWYQRSTLDCRAALAKLVVRDQAAEGVMVV